VTVLADGIPIHLEQCPERCRNGVAHGPDGRIGVAMGAALGLADDLIDHGESHQIVRRDLHVGGGSWAFAVSRHRIEAAPSGEITL